MNFFRNLLRKKKKGFTLIELIIVIAIIAVLVGLAIPRFLTIQRDSKIKTDIANGKTVCNAVSAIIAQDKLDISNEPTIELKNSGDKSTDKDTENDNNKKVLESYLQTIPEPKLDNSDHNKYFKVEITKNQKGTGTNKKVDQDQPYDIKVYVAKDGRNQSEVYPKSEGYGKVD